MSTPAPSDAPTPAAQPSLALLRRSPWLVLALLLVLLLLGWLLYQPVQAWLADPLLQALWQIYAFYRLVPGVITWSAALVIGYFIAVLTLLHPPQARPMTLVVEELPNARRVEAFTRWLERSHRPYYRYHLNQIVSEIGVQTLAHEWGLSPEQARQRLRRGGVPLPNGAPADSPAGRYLQKGLLPWPDAERERPERPSLPHLWPWLARTKAKPASDQPLQLEKDFEPTLFYLEQLLEVKRDLDHS